MINRKIKPDFGVIGDLPEISYSTYNLDSGVQVYVVDQKEHDVLKLDLVFPAGTAFQKQPLQAIFTNSLFDSGTDKLDAFNIAEGFDFFGSYIESSCSKDYATITLYSLRKHFSDSLQLLNEVIEGAIFPESEVEIHKANSKQRYIVNTEKVSTLAKRSFSQLIYTSDSNYYSKVSPSDFDTISSEDIRSFYHTNYLGAMPIAFLSGNAGEKEMNVLNYLLSIKWNNNNAKEIKAQPNNPVEKRLQKDGALQSAIRIGKVLFNMRHEDYPAMVVVNAILGGYFGSRLMTNIREDKGYTYGIGSGISAYKESGVFYIVTEVGKEVTEPTLAEIQKEIEILQTELVPASELELVRNYLLGSLLKKTNGAFSQSEMLKNSVVFGTDHNFHKKLETTLRSITPEDILRLTKTYLKWDSFVSVVAGDFK